MATLVAPDGVSLPATPEMTRGDHVRLREVLVTLLDPEQPTALVMKDANTEIMDRETEIEE